MSQVRLALALRVRLLAPILQVACNEGTRVETFAFLPDSDVVFDAGTAGRGTRAACLEPACEAVSKLLWPLVNCNCRPCPAQTLVSQPTSCIESASTHIVHQERCRAHLPLQWQLAAGRPGLTSLAHAVRDGLLDDHILPCLDLHQLPAGSVEASPVGLILTQMGHLGIGGECSLKNFSWSLHCAALAEWQGAWP